MLICSASRLLSGQVCTAAALIDDDAISRNRQDPSHQYSGMLMFDG